MKLEEIEDVISKTTAKIENFLDDTSQTLQKNNQYDALVEAEKNKASTYLSAAEVYNKKATELLKDIPSQYREWAKNGAISITDFVGESEAKIAEAIEEYREWAQKADDAEVGYLEAIAQQTAYRVEQLQDIADDFENIINFIDSQSNLLQAEMDFIEETGNRLSAKFYEQLINDANKKAADLNREKQELQKILDQAVKTGDVKVGSDEWYEMLNTINEVDSSIIECKTDIEGFQNSINDLKWNNLDKFIEELNNIESQISNLYDIISDDSKVVDEIGNWTNEGITSLGLLSQKMELAQYTSKQYGDAIQQLQKDYKNGKYSTDEYNEKLAELTEKQWDSINAYEQTKQEIVSLNKVRIDAVKEGIQKEIDAYKELIDAKKESLDADKESRDFADEVAEKQKSITTIQRQITALANDNSASATAKRKQLQADLLNAQKDLEDYYYNHSIDTQKDALDKEYEAYEKNKQDEMDALDEWVKDVDRVVTESLDLVQANAENVMSTIVDTVNMYGIQISDIITSPWKDGTTAISDYEHTFSAVADSLIDKLNAIKTAQEELVRQADKTAQNTIQSIQSNTNKETSAKYTTPPTNTGSTNTSSSSQTPATKASPTKGETVVVKKTATHFSNKSNNLRMNSYVPGGSYTVMSVSGDQVLIGRNGVATGWVKLTDLQGYAKGSTNIKKNQFALIDELGEELVLNAGPDGRLQYLSKGSGVIPADLTERLMNLALDPTKTLDASRPNLGAPHITNNNFNVNLEFGSLVTVGHVDQETMPELQKMVRKEFDGMMKQLNNKIFSKVR